MLVSGLGVTSLENAFWNLAKGKAIFCGHCHQVTEQRCFVEMGTQNF